MSSLPFRAFAVSVYQIFSFSFGKVSNILWERRQSFIVFSFSKEGHIFDKKNIGQSSLSSFLKHHPLFSFQVSQSILEIIF